MIAYFPDAPKQSLQDELDAYCAIFPEDAAGLEGLRMQLERGERLFDRHNYTGHICGAGIVLSPDRTKVLLVHHKLYNRWQQPGGHAEAADLTPLAAAWRETTEETAVDLREVLPVEGRAVPVQIGVHPVPENPKKQEAAHVHYDFRYVFVARSERLQAQLNETHAAAWIPLNDKRLVHIAEAVARVRRYILADNG